MTDVLLIGVFHFSESDLNFSSPDIQKQLDELAENIARLSPDAVAVELDKDTYPDPIIISNGKWKEHSINEAYQLGGRIAACSGLDTIHPIDKIVSLNDAMISPENLSLISRRLEYLHSISPGNGIHKCILDMNSSEYITQNANMYLDINSRNRDDYYMSKCLADWYYRNLCIFSNIQSLSVNHCRIVVIYGAGHIPILRDLINTSDSMNLIDVDSVL